MSIFVFVDVCYRVFIDLISVFVSGEVYVFVFLWIDI